MNTCITQGLREAWTMSGGTRKETAQRHRKREGTSHPGLVVDTRTGQEPRPEDAERSEIQTVADLNGRTGSKDQAEGNETDGQPV